jgi:hypothetical protein
MKLTLLSILGLTFGAVFATAEEPVPVEVIHEFIQSHCINCHSGRKQKGDTNLRPLIDDAASVDLELLVSIFDQINLEEMPPEDEEQPTIDEKSKMLAFLDGAIKDKGSSPLDKKTLPGYGNYVDHKALFEGTILDSASAPPPRIWRYSPESYSERVNRIVGHDVVKFVPIATFPVPQKGLKHPAFPYKGAAHTAKDYANIHDFGLTETELLIGLAEELSAAQFTSGSLSDYQKLPPGDAKWTRLLDDQFRKLYSRTPTSSERRSLLDLQKSVAETSSIQTANQTMISATYLRPESLFRFEIGDTTSGAGDRAALSPLEYAYAGRLCPKPRGPHVRSRREI